MSNFFPFSSAPSSWFGFRLYTSSWEDQNLLLLNILDQLGDTTDWWYMRKGDLGPHIRFRAYGGSIEVLCEMIAALKSEKLLTHWHLIPYEPEEYLFGGPIGMSLAHHHFVIDSRYFCSWLKGSVQYAPNVGPLEMSMTLLHYFLQSCRLERSERWDVWKRVQAYRTAPTETLDALYIDNEASLDQFLISVETLDHLDLSKDQRSSLDQHLVRIRNLGEALAKAHATGQLTRGIRAILCWLILFHWNRWGLSLAEQAALCHFMGKLTEP